MPNGGWFVDSSRADTYMSVIGTMFAVVLAFVILFSLQSYQHARDAASREAIAVAIHLIVHIARIGADRRVTEVVSVHGYDAENDRFNLDVHVGAPPATAPGAAV